MGTRREPTKSPERSASDKAYPSVALTRASARTCLVVQETEVGTVFRLLTTPSRADRTAPLTHTESEAVLRLQFFYKRRHMTLKKCGGPCGRLLPEDGRYFYRSPGDNRNFRGRCKACCRAAAAANYRRDPKGHNKRTNAARAIRITNGGKA